MYCKYSNIIQYVKVNYYRIHCELEHQTEGLYLHQVSVIVPINAQALVVESGLCIRSFAEIN